MPLISGVAWIIVAIVVLRFDYTSVAAISVLFGVIALFAAGTETVIAGVSTGGWRWLHLLLAVAFAIAGITAFFQPGGTFVALAAVVSFYLIFRGISDIAIGLSLSGAASVSWVSVLTGFLELLLGFWAAGSWGLSATLSSRGWPPPRYFTASAISSRPSAFASHASAALIVRRGSERA